jgi:hypothetical protein
VHALVSTQSYTYPKLTWHQLLAFHHCEPGPTATSASTGVGVVPQRLWQVFLPKLGDRTNHFPPIVAEDVDPELELVVGIEASNGDAGHEFEQLIGHQVL